MSHSNESHQRTYPVFLHQADMVLGLLGITAVMAGIILLIIQVWEDNNLDWLFQTIANLGVVLAVCVFAISINRLLGRSKSIVVRIAHACFGLCFVAALVVGTLVIWQITDSDVAWRTMGTIAILVIGSLLGIGVSRMISR
ncbi:MAG: hypothetical protein MK100_00180 [Phycisphaerales bacterium]|nr:hypothetical protein [Phycisphaerales bacterium]